MGTDSITQDDAPMTPTTEDGPPDTGKTNLDKSDALKMQLTEAQQQVFGEKIGAARKDAKERAYRYVYQTLGVTTLDEAKTLIQHAKTNQSKESARLRDLESQIEAAKHDADTAAQKLRDQVATLQAERDKATSDAQRALKVAAVRIAASAKHFHNPDDALQFLDLDSLNVEMKDTTGTVLGVDDAIATLADERPYLLDAASTPAPASPTPPPVPPLAVPPTPNGKPLTPDTERLAVAQEEMHRMTRTWF